MQRKKLLKSDRCLSRKIEDTIKKERTGEMTMMIRSVSYHSIFILFLLGLNTNKTSPGLGCTSFKFVRLSYEHDSNCGEKHIALLFSYVKLRLKKYILLAVEGSEDEMHFHCRDWRQHG